MKILIVDDNKSQARLLGDIMESEGFETAVASDGREALDLLDKQRVDCIISDVQMPHIDGFRLAFKIRSNEGFAHIPFIMYTAGDAKPDDEKFAESLGVAKYLRKPGSNREIVRIVHDLLSSPDSGKENHQSRRDKWMMANYGRLLIDKLDHSLTTFATAVDQTSIISKTDPDGRITHANQNFLDVSGYTEKDLLGKDHRMISSGFHPASFWDEMWNTIESGKTWRAHVKNKARNGSTFWADTFVIPVKNVAGTIEEYLCLRSDITLAKTAEEELQQKRLVLEKAQETAHLGYWMFDGNRINCSAETIRMFRISEADFDGSSPEQMFINVHPADRPALLDSRRNMISGKGSLEMDFRVVMNDETRWVHARAETIRNQEGGIIGAIGVIQDITERKQIEENRRELSERYELLSRATNDAVWDADLLNGTIVWNHAIREIFGYIDPPTTSEWWSQQIHPEDLPGLRAYVDEVKRNRESNWSRHYRFRCANGTFKDVFNRSYVIYDGEGKAVRMIGAFQDETEKKRAAEEIEKLSLVASKTNNAVLIFDREFKIDWVNEGFQNLTGYTHQEVRGQPIEFLYGVETDRNITRRIQRCLSNQQDSSEELINYGHDGRKYWVRNDITPVFSSDDNLMYFICIQTDITELKDVETSIVTIARELSNLIENANVPIFGINTDGNINEWNKVAASLLEYQKSEIHGQPATRLFDAASAMTFNRIIDDVFKEVVTQTVELKAVTKSNKRVTLFISVSPRRNSDRDVIGAIVVAQNITELIEYRSSLEAKVQERTRELNEALAKEKELVEMKSRFVSVASHEFRTPLSTITAATGLLKKHHQKLDSRQIVAKLENIEKQVIHMTYLLDDVLTVERANAGKLKVQRKELDLHDFLSSLCQEVQTSRENSHTIRLVENLLIPTIVTDEKLLRSILVNLLTNAVKFSPDKDLVEVTVSSDLEKATLAVRDFGIGIPKADVENLFQPFFRGGNTSDIQGTGLGLSIIKKSVDLLKGSIAIESEEGKGTQFTITLPTKYA